MQKWVRIDPDVFPGSADCVSVSRKENNNEA